MTRDPQSPLTAARSPAGAFAAARWWVLAGPLDLIGAAGAFDGPVGCAVHRCRDDGRVAWAALFAVALSELIDGLLFRLDVVVANLTCAGRGSVGHPERLVAAVAACGRHLAGWFDPRGRPTLVKLEPTTPSRGRSPTAKRAIGAELGGVLRVSAPRRVVGRRVVVVDSGCTMGSQLAASARVLLDHGAARVAGLTDAAETTPGGSWTVLPRPELPVVGS